MESLIVIVGFLGAGKTTLLKRLVKNYIDIGKKPTIILNDYQNAQIESQQFLDFLEPDQINSLSGSCICCSGVAELRSQVNSIPQRENGITLIEANGTSDACSLMGFLGVGLNEHLLPPIQIGVVDVKNWQKRDYNNILEANQVQVSSMIILNHHEGVSEERIEEVKKDMNYFNPSAKVVLWNDLTIDHFTDLIPSTNSPEKMDHLKSHWASCSVDLPDPMSSESLKTVLKQIPESVLRVKGCTKLDENKGYTYFERVPTGEVSMRPYFGDLITGPKLLSIGPGSDPEKLSELIKNS